MSGRRKRLGLLVAVVFLGCGCQRVPTDDDGLRIDVMAEERTWRCEGQEKVLAFLDDDGDGLASACEVNENGRLMRRVHFPRREYSGCPLVPGGLNPDNMTSKKSRTVTVFK